MKGIRHQFKQIKRIGGWCEPMFEFLCIAHPRAAVFDVKVLEADAAAALLAGAFIEAIKGFRLAEPNLGGTADKLIRPEHR